MEKSKSLCAGCYDDEYNHGLGGAKECWSYETARIVKKLEIPIELRPPYDLSSAKDFFQCYRKPGFVHVSPDSLDTKGYWKN